GIGAVIVDRDDVGVVEGGGGARLPLETGAEPLVRRGISGGDADHLHRHRPVEPQVPRAVDGAHPASTDHLIDAVTVDQGPTGEKTFDTVHLGPRTGRWRGGGRDAGIPAAGRVGKCLPFIYA